MPGYLTELYKDYFKEKNKQVQLQQFKCATEYYKIIKKIEQLPKIANNGQTSIVYSLNEIVSEKCLLKYPPININGIKINTITEYASDNGDLNTRNYYHPKEYLVEYDWKDSPSEEK